MLKRQPSAEHLQARQVMLQASMMGAVAFQKGLGVNHSCAHALSTVCDLHHGLANGVLLPYSLDFNAIAVPERLTALAAAVGAPQDGFAPWVKNLQLAINMPQHFSAAQVTDKDIEPLVEVALADAADSISRLIVESDGLGPCRRDSTSVSFATETNHGSDSIVVFESTSFSSAAA